MLEALRRFRIDPARWKGHTSLLLATGVATILGLVLLIALLASLLQGGDPHFSAYSGEPDGLSLVRGELEGTHAVETVAGRAFSLREVEDPQRTILLVAGVERRYSGSELQEILEFVEEGGKVVIADDFGEANSVSRGFGWRFDNAWLLDEAAQGSGDAELVDATAELRTGVFPVVLARPSSLSPQGETPAGFSARVLARSSPRSYSDIDGNGRIETGIDRNQADGFVIMVELVHPLGGRIVFVSDVEVFINDLVDERQGNLAFAEALAAHLFDGEPGTVLFDESRHVHRGQAAYEVLGYGVAVTRDPVLSALLLLAAFGTSALLWLLLRGPEDWHHKFDASGVRPREAAPDSLPHRLRRILEAAVRVRAGVGPERVPGMGRAEVERALGDPVLADFLLQPRASVSDADIQDIVNRIRRLSA